MTGAVGRSIRRLPSQPPAGQEIKRPQLGVGCWGRLTGRAELEGASVGNLRVALFYVHEITFSRVVPQQIADPDLGARPNIRRFSRCLGLRNHGCMARELRRMLAPWMVEEGESTYVVRTTNGFVVSVTYFDDEPNGDFNLRKEEARRLAVAISRLPELLEKDKGG